MKKYETLKKLTDVGVVAVVRAESKDEAKKIVDAVGKGGIKAIEITMTVPGAVEIIADLVENASDDMVIGAGTVLDAETARMCILAGARYIVSPHLSESVMKLCHRYAIPCMPGVGTVTEVVRALELGAEVVKAFPGEVLGPQFIKAVKGPLPHAKIMPTGGVSLENMEKWFTAGAFAVGMGGALTKPGGVKGNMRLVTETARTIVEKIAPLQREC